MKRLFLVVLTLVLVFCDLPGSGSFDVGGYAAAQQPGQQRRMNLLDLIFGGALRPMGRPKPEEPRARRVIVSPSGPDVTVRAPQPQKQVVEKAENAAKVLVVGDFMASSLQSGLEQTYAENPNVVFIDAGNGLSGIVRDDVVDWPARVPELIDENRPLAVVVLVGMNDRQQMRLESGRVEKLTDAWNAEYERRVEAIVKAVRDRALPLFWVGLPPVKSGRMNRDYLVFNETYRAKVQAAGGKFIDIWDGFTGSDGGFITAGPDVNGQIVRLRNSDGINMTSAGKEKMAFYAERELRKIPGLANTAVSVALPGLDGQSQALEPQYDPASSGRTVVVSLDGPALDGGTALEGSSDGEDGSNASNATSYDLVVRGIGLTPHKGRIDYEWGAPGTIEEAPLEQRKDQAASSDQ